MSFSYDKRKLFHNFDFYLGGNERIWLSGPNGCGKTTLLKLIAGILSPAEGSISYASRLKIGYFQQDLSYLNTADIVIDSLRASYRDETYIRTLMGCIGLDNTIAQKSLRDLSWGEKAKVQIMDLLLKKHNVLLLDEPTNHLDMKSRELLGNALNEYSGALIFVSHDRAFIDQLCTREVKL
ncbi:MAG: ATP-binding cassette, subfamily er 3 [Candidatus Cloacimonadota bacterium]|nr:ATP-binding cassette, subfamily er 3 [Candidatus Cloacimonadota bacterium]